MAKTGIPKDIKERVSTIVDQFNQEVIADSRNYFFPRYRGRYLYLSRGKSKDEALQICRLKYTGKMEKWEFAIYKYSTERYDPKEWIFPGTEFVDGTVEGAMKAGVEAYPIFNTPNTFPSVRILVFLLNGILSFLNIIFLLTRKKRDYPFPYDNHTGSITLPADLEKELRGLVSTGKKPEAVKRVTQLTGADLRAAKDYVDNLSMASE